MAKQRETVAVTFRIEPAFRRKPTCTYGNVREDLFAEKPDGNVWAVSGLCYNGGNPMNLWREPHLNLWVGVWAGDWPFQNAWGDRPLCQEHSGMVGDTFFFMFFLLGPPLAAEWVFDIFYPVMHAWSWSQSRWLCWPRFFPQLYSL